jgi:hypothetical protein
MTKCLTDSSLLSASKSESKPSFAPQPSPTLVSTPTLKSGPRFDSFAFHDHSITRRSVKHSITSVASHLSSFFIRIPSSYQPSPANSLSAMKRRCSQAQLVSMAQASPMKRVRSDPLPATTTNTLCINLADLRLCPIGTLATSVDPVSRSVILHCRASCDHPCEHVNTFIRETISSQQLMHTCLTLCDNKRHLTFVHKQHVKSFCDSLQQHWWGCSCRDKYAIELLARPSQLDLMCDAYECLVLGDKLGGARITRDLFYRVCPNVEIRLDDPRLLLALQDLLRYGNMAKPSCLLRMITMSWKSVSQ